MLHRFWLRHYGTFVIAGLAVIPVGLWLLRADMDVITADNVALIKAFGKGAALSGIVLYSLMPVLSMRHRIIEYAFGGLDKVYSLHASSGKVSFYLILAHPLLLGSGGLLGGSDLAGLWDWTSWLIVLGLIGAVGLVVVTVFAIYSHIKHQRWIIVHRMFGWLLPVFFAHALIARSQIVQNRALFVYIAAIGSLGLAAFLYRSVVGRLLVKKYRYIVAQVNHVTPTITELILRPTGIPITYLPGQFAYLSVKDKGMDDEAHPFSFTTVNNTPYVRFAVKELGDDTKQLKHVRPGSKAYLEGPYGNFSYQKINNKQQIWIAGGVGITPFLSMARSLSRRSKYHIHLFYAAQELADAAFLQELISIRKDAPDTFNVTIVDRHTSGLVSSELLAKEIPDLTAPDFLICGPPPMMLALRDQLIKKGVSAEKIHMENFSML